MADYSTDARIVLTLNGKQAQSMMKQLQGDADTLRKKIDAASKIGDKALMQKFQKELTATNNMMRKLSDNTRGADAVLRKLDTATPNELRRALSQLNRELRTMERGSAAWDAHVDKIRQVKAEIREINDEINGHESAVDKTKGFFDGIGGKMLGAGAAITGLTALTRAAVDAYAGMEQEEANVRKFTGMTAEQVASLNNEFKKMDTRTSREQLNMLAQEAGRLGKQTEEDVLGYVRAADKINVALDDLGEGATLTLSKLTGIFGDEKRLGTEKALLSVGSVINELSQNCSASAPYIAEFASRVGGVGSQAGMTAQQIMAYAAVFDTANQKVEASSTALSQVIVRIFQDPANYAKAAGLDVKKFSDLVKTDINAALLELLDALNKVGGMDVLSPIFADMGEKGSRAVSALSTLAGHIDEVRAQQEVANQAFAEATSIDKEYEVQNNTVAASLDKARNRLHEVVVELGERLGPAITLGVRAVTRLASILSGIIKTLANNKSAIVGAIAAYAAYTLAIKGATIATQAFIVVEKAWYALLTAGRGALQALQVGWIAITGGITRATAAMRAFSATLKTSGIGIILSLGGMLVGKLFDMASAAKAAREEQARLNKEHREYIKSLTDVSSTAAQYVTDETNRVKALYRVATDEKASRKDRLSAVNELKATYPEFLSQLSNETIMAGQAAAQFDQLAASIRNVARAKAAEKKMIENEEAILDLEIQRDSLQSGNAGAQAKADAERAKLEKIMSLRDRPKSKQPKNLEELIKLQQKNYRKALREAQKITPELDELNAKIADRVNANEELAGRYQIASTRLAEVTAEGVVRNKPGYTPSAVDDDKKKGKVDKFKGEKEWRAEQQALADLAYQTAEITKGEHARRMAAIDEDYYTRILDRDDLTSKERAEALAKMYEAFNKEIQTGTAELLAEENDRYAREQAQAQASYRAVLEDQSKSQADITAARERYDIQLEEIQLAHLLRLKNMTVEGTEERQKAEKALADAEVKALENKHKRLEAKIAESIRKRREAEKADKKMKPYNAGVDSPMAGSQEIYKEYADAVAALDAKLRNHAITTEQYNAALAKLNKNLASGVWNAVADKIGGIGGSVMKLGGTFVDVFSRIRETGKITFEDMGVLASAAADTMAQAFATVSQFISMQADIDVAHTEAAYDRKIAAAEGNSYKEKKLEKEKQAEVAKIKNDANRKMYAMQVAQAIAQTAANALMAYGSLVGIPVVGPALAAVAAAMAIASGMIQVAAIKKQQQASEAQGYSEGGFTRPGRRDEPAGVVHAGEWVASQKLVNNPKTRPLLEALDYAQRTNTIGSLTAADVSRSVTAPMVIAAQSSAPMQPNVVVNVPPQEPQTDMAETLARLNERLDEPFVTVNTVTGDAGTQKAQDDYNRLMKNKTRKSKKTK